MGSMRAPGARFIINVLCVSVILLLATIYSPIGWHGGGHRRLFQVSTKKKINAKSSHGGIDMAVREDKYDIIAERLHNYTSMYGPDLPKFVSAINADHVVKAVAQDLQNEVMVRKRQYSTEATSDIPIEDLVDVVILIRFGDNLEELLGPWKSEIERLHVIFIVNEGVINIPLIPEWLDYELYTISDLIACLVDRKFVIGANDGGLGSDVALLQFGAWVSNKDYVYILDQYSQPHVPFNQGSESETSNETYSQNIGVIRQHLTNILTPSTPYYYHGSYDPFLPGNDFSKGMPRFLRRGQLTAISHGITSNKVTFDAINQLLNNMGNEYNPTSLPLSSSQQQSETVPFGSLYSFSLMNSMYHTHIIGSCLSIFQPDPVAFYSGNNFAEFYSYREIISGWILKTALDYLGVGVKIGPPLVTYPKLTNGMTNDTLRDLYFDAAGYNKSSPHWLKDIFIFLSEYDFSKSQTALNSLCPRPTNDFVQINCFMSQIAIDIYYSLGVKYPYFKYYANLMVSYQHVWWRRKNFLGEIFPIASKRSKGPHSHNSTCAVITIAHNEATLLPIWVRYYSRHVPIEDMYILDHMSFDGSTDISRLPKGINVKKLSGNKFNMPVAYRSSVIKQYQDQLLRLGYKCVLFSDTDEFVTANPHKYPNGLKQYLQDFVSNSSRLHQRVTAYELGHLSYGNGSSLSLENAIDWQMSLLKQRQFYVLDPLYNKPLLSKIPLSYRPGFHHLYNRKTNVETDSNLVMFHIRSIDKSFCEHREQWKYNMTKNMDPTELARGFASHWNSYRQSQSKGHICRFAIGCFQGIFSHETKVYDNTGTIEMTRLDSLWSTVDI